MKYLKSDGENLVFQMGAREKTLLMELLKLYPLVPPGHHQIGSPTEKSVQTHPNQQLLEEAVAEHRQENKKQLDAMLQDPKRFRSAANGYQLVLSAYELEWLLQVLNDVRVGSWLLLGAPDEQDGARLRITAENARYLWAMELSGHFQYALLSARDQA